jgi:predicted transposase YdaD
LVEFQTSDDNQRKVLAFIQSIVVKKFPKLSPEEIQAMLNLTNDIKNTAYYRSVMENTKLEIVPELLEQGVTVEQIAKALKLDVEEVQKIAAKGQ